MTDPDTYQSCRDFLHHEAELLDDRRLEEWLDLLADEVEYLAPKRVVREKGAEKSEFKEDTFYFLEDRSSLEERVEKLAIEESWGENPPSRTRRLVGNIRIQSNSSDTIELKNNLLMYHNKGIPQRETIIPAERHDELIRVGGSLKLSNRKIYMDVNDLTIVLTVFL